MKPIALSSCLAVAAFSLYAADPQASKDSPTPTLTHAETYFSQTTAIVDSPLVRAAKSANRFGKKPSQVITNETLVHEGGHFTVSSPEAQAKKPAGLSPEQIKAEAAADAEQSKKSEERKKTTTARPAAPAEGAYNDPPALEAPTLEPIKSSAPQTMQQQKPPL